MQDFDGDPPLVLEIAREVDRGHSALAELSLESIAIGERRAE